jgi:tryptophan 2,3-dioxygenase
MPATSYWTYLSLDRILDAQHPLTEAHDEMLFVIVHQAFEVWFRLAIFELREVNARLRSGDLAAAAHYLARVNRVVATSQRGFEVMDTMTPEAFAEFREALIPASGTQSFQFRELELLAGIPKLRRADGAEYYYWEDTPEAGATLKEFFARYGARLAEVEKEVRENGSLCGLFESALRAATGAPTLREAVGRAIASGGDAERLCREMASFDRTLLAWRDRHVRTTEHAIGERPGTARNIDGTGPLTPCVTYLESTSAIHRRLLLPDVRDVIEGL